MAAPVADTEAETAPLVALYESHGGNLEAIFTELGDDPGKALKYPPKDAAEFAKKVCAFGMEMVCVYKRGKFLEPPICLKGANE